MNTSIVKVLTVNTMINKRQRGFTLVELMIVMAIIAVIAAIAIPSYQDSVRKSRRADAKNKLLEVAKEEERWFYQKNVYADGAVWTTARPDGWGVANPIKSSEGWYDITVDTTAATTGCSLDNICYVLTATPVSGSPQAADAKCATLILNQTGAQSATGTEPTACWR